MTDELREIRGPAEIGTVPGLQFDRGSKGPVLLVLIDKPQFGHSANDISLSVLGATEIGDGRITAGGLDQTGQHRDLRKVELLHPFVEIALRGSLHAIGPVSEIDVVQIKREDLLLGQMALQAKGVSHLLQLPEKASLGREKKGPD